MHKRKQNKQDALLSKPEPRGNAVFALRFSRVTEISELMMLGVAPVNSPSKATIVKSHQF